MYSNSNSSASTLEDFGSGGSSSGVRNVREVKIMIMIIMKRTRRDRSSFSSLVLVARYSGIVGIFFLQFSVVIEVRRMFSCDVLLLLSSSTFHFSTILLDSDCRCKLVSFFIAFKILRYILNKIYHII
jgi:hypothetical protein